MRGSPVAGSPPSEKPLVYERFDGTGPKKGPAVGPGLLSLIFAAGSSNEPCPNVDERSANVALRRLNALCPWHDRPCRDVRQQSGGPSLRSRDAARPHCARL